MKRKENFFPVFFVVFFLCILILTLSLSGRLKFLSFLEKPALAIQGLSYNLFQKLPFVSESAKVKKLENENLEFLSRVADFEKLKKENAALSDQFQTAYPSSSKLLKVSIIGSPGFIPGISIPNAFILDKGSKDGLKVGQGAVIKNNLVGTIAGVSPNLSKVNILGSPSVSFTAKTENGAVGVIKGGGSLTLDNVLLSENITEGELVLTKGGIGGDGVGIPPDLIVGEIASVEKNPSDLFQKAKVESFVNFVNLTSVFVYVQIE